MLTEDAPVTVQPRYRRGWTKKVLSLDRLGQILASLCWICSVLAYGLNSTGDWLQLCAASAWLLASVAAVMSTKDE